jgi:RNA polymerase sigma-70 factor (ECF subfamily)
MPSPLEDTLSRENLAAYESALARLPQRTRDAVILRLEFGFDYQAVAEAIGAPTANASRMLITRALVQMAEAMNGTGG